MKTETLVLLGIGGLVLYVVSKNSGTNTQLGSTGGASGSVGSLGSFGGLLSNMGLGSLFSPTKTSVQGDNTPALINAGANAFNSLIAGVKSVGNLWGSPIGASGGISSDALLSGPKIGFDWGPGLSPAQSGLGTPDVIDTAPYASAGGLYYA
jgi:hypothetical protein